MRKNSGTTDASGVDELPAMLFDKMLNAQETSIPGLLLIDLPVKGDNRGWFKENWQREKMTFGGLRHFTPLQQNISLNDTRGTTRGVHAEPWDKFVSVLSGTIFGAWVDLRPGAGFGKVFTHELDPSQAVFIPRGVGNAFQTLTDQTIYGYLTNGLWDAEESYSFVNLADEDLAIPWPIPLKQAEISARDRTHPSLVSVHPVEPKKTLIVGMNGQLGRALKRTNTSLNTEFVGRREMDLSKREGIGQRSWKDYSTIINAAAYTAADAAEAEGRLEAWAVNVHAVKAMVQIAYRHDITLAHVSSDYVFDGSRECHDEAEHYAPLNVYGQTKAAGDALVSTLPRHYIVRTSWVVGEGKNFVRTMMACAAQGREVRVVDDQHGRLTFAHTLASAIVYLLENGSPFGTYNVSNSGPAQSWYEIAYRVYQLCDADPDLVVPISSEEYARGKTVVPRPRHSTLSLEKIRAEGFHPGEADDALREYIQREKRRTM